MKHLYKEVKLLERIDHPFCIHFYCFLEDVNCYYLIQEYASASSLHSYLKSYTRIDEDRAKKIFCQIVSALRYLHEEMLIVHRDLKLENILFDANYNIRLIDFGFSTLETNSEKLFNTFCGSLNYMAPEIFAKKPYTSSVDMWSLGIILYTMLVGHLPFFHSSASKLRELVLTTEPTYPDYLSDPVIDLLKKLLEKDPKKRITAAETAFHPWVKNSTYSYYCSDSFLMNSRFKILPAESEVVPEDVRKRYPNLVPCIAKMIKTQKLLTQNSPEKHETIPRSLSGSFAHNAIESQLLLSISSTVKKATSSSLGISDKAMVATRKRTINRKVSQPQTFSEQLIVVPV